MSCVQGLLQQEAGVEMVGQFEPQEHAALGLFPAQAGRGIALERGQHGVAAGAIDRAGAGDLRVIAGGGDLMHARSG